MCIHKNSSSHLLLNLYFLFISVLEILGSDDSVSGAVQGTANRSP